MYMGRPFDLVLALQIGAPFGSCRAPRSISLFWNLGTVALFVPNHVVLPSDSRAKGWPSRTLSIMI
uniref:Uncharacterized protein n=1 Tax=Leersia perrieri TaxID=77586 RepID=A0A0D9W8Q3_9ORYZ